MASRGGSKALVLLSAWVLAWAGCAQSVPRPQIGYSLAPRTLLAVRRVVLVQLAPAEGPTEVADSMTTALRQALQRRKLFHVDVIPRTSPACRDLTLNKLEAYSLDELRRMRRELNCDVVLFGAVNGFRSYPSMRIALDLRMVDLRAGTLAWGVSHTWDSTDGATEARMKQFFKRRMRGGYSPADWRLARMSVKIFQKFVAEEAASTLPARAQMARLIAAQAAPPSAPGPSGLDRKASRFDRSGRQEK